MPHSAAEGEAMISGNIHERSHRPSDETLTTFWEDVKAGLWVWLVIVAVAAAVLWHYANWSVLDL
jgi:hypothetical protein